jgi:hypothetical protein
MAIAQNCRKTEQITGIVDAFVDRGAWEDTLRGQESWTRQLRYIAIHMMWLRGQGYELPDDLDLEYWVTTVFADIQGVDYGDGSSVGSGWRRFRKTVARTS